MTLDAKGDVYRRNEPVTGPQEYGRVPAEGVGTYPSLQDVFSRLAGADNHIYYGNPYADQSMTQRIMGDPGQNTTFLGKLFPQQAATGAFRVETSSPTASLTRDPNLKVTDGAKVKQETAGNLGAAKEARSQALGCWGAGKNLALSSLKSAAPECGVNIPTAESTFVPDHPVTNAGMIAAIGVDTMTGGLGTFMTAGMGGMFLASEIMAEIKKLPSKEAEKVADLALERAQSFTPPADTRFMQSAPPPDFSDFNRDDFIAFLEADFENQPEIMALDNTIAALKGVQDNHAYVERHYANEGPDQAAAVLPVYADATHTQLVSDFMAGIEKGVSVPLNGFDSRTVAAMPKPQQNLEPDPRQLAMQREMSITAQLG